MQAPIFEILSWQAAENISDDDMISAMQTFSREVMLLPGFLHQSMYKNKKDEWICIYYWENEQQAHDSNLSVANWPSFQHLMSLIVQGSVSMEVLKGLQSQGQLKFD